MRGAAGCRAYGGKMHFSKAGGSVFSTRNVIIIACVALLIFLGAVAVIVAVMSDTGSMGEREYIESKLAELGDGDLGHKNVAAHIVEYGIGGFDSGKMRRIEYYFNSEYPKELPTIGAMAYKTAELYMEYYFDRVDPEDKEAVTTALLRCFVESTGDAYAVYRTSEELADFDVDMSGTFVGIGVTVLQTLDPSTGMLESVVVEDVINGSGADDGGILPGDMIIAVDSKAISEFDRSSLVSAIRGEEGTTVLISVMRGDERLDLRCERRKVVDRTVEHTISGNIGYIEISSFKSNTPELFAEALNAVKAAGVKGIIFDLRDNPGGYLDAVLEVLDMLVPSKVPLASYVDAHGDETVFTSTGSGSALTVPSVVICNENTASAGELFTAAMRDFDAMGICVSKSVGTRTYGKGIMQNTYTLFDGSSITLTTAFYNPPSGKNYDGIGIEPSVEVALVGTVDTQLERAVSELEALMSPSSDQNSAL